MPLIFGSCHVGMMLSAGAMLANQTDVKALVRNTYCFIDQFLPFLTTISPLQSLEMSIICSSDAGRNAL